MNSYNRNANTSKALGPPLHSVRLLDQVRERLRYRLRTKDFCLYWVRFFIRQHGLRHPRDMGQPEVASFLHMPVLAKPQCVARPLVCACHLADATCEQCGGADHAGVGDPHLPVR